MTNTIPNYSDLMLEDLRNAINVRILPGGEERFQAALVDAEKAIVASADGLARLISLANAALAVADQDEGRLGPWYRDMARRLLYRATDALVVMDATVGRPSAGELN
jgi:hypothetical protein